MSYKSLLVTKIITYFKSQCAKKLVSNSLRLVDCAIGLVNTVLNLITRWAGKVFLGVQIAEELYTILLIKYFFQGS